MAHDAPHSPSGRTSPTTKPETTSVASFDPARVEQATARTEALALPHTRVSHVVERGLLSLGALLAWIWLPLMILIVVNVILRYLFNQSFIALEELQWHIYGAGIMLGLSYCFLKDGHVRVDVLAERLSLTLRAWIELAGLLLLLGPFIHVVLDYAIPFVGRSYLTGEVSSAPGGLPMRWLFKSFILFGFGLLALAAMARLTRVTAHLFGFPRPVASPHMPGKSRQ